ASQTPEPQALHVVGIRVAGRAADPQLVAGRRRDAADDDPLAIERHALELVDAARPREAVVVVRLDRDRAAIDQPPARALGGALGVGAVGQRAALRTLGARALDGV